MIDAQTLITIVTVLGSAGAWQFYQSRLKLKHEERKEDKGEQTLFRDDLRERVAVLEQKLEEAYEEKQKTQERLAVVMTELAEYKVRLEFLETDSEDEGYKKKPAPRQGVRVNYGNIPGFDDRGLVFTTEPVGESTHLYAAETLDGNNWFAFPTLFQDPDGTWVDMSEYQIEKFRTNL